MTSQPDKLFREKLENFQKPAPAAAWQRVEAGLEKTSHKGLWLKIAAGLTLLSVATILLWPAENGIEPMATNNSNPVPKDNNSITAEINSQATPNSQAEKEVKENERVISKEKKKEPILVAQSIEEPVKQESITINQEVTAIPEVIVAQQTEAVENPIEEKVSSRKIVYSADEVNTRFLKKESIAQATSDEKKSSGIQKLVSLAYDLKNGDSGLGDLRQKKDEILALNFRENKQKQN